MQKQPTWFLGMKSGFSIMVSPFNKEFDSYWKLSDLFSTNPCCMAKDTERCCSLASGCGWKCMIIVDLSLTAYFETQISRAVSHVFSHRFANKRCLSLINLDHLDPTASTLRHFRWNSLFQQSFHRCSSCHRHPSRFAGRQLSKQHQLLHSRWLWAQNLPLSFASYSNHDTHCPFKPVGCRLKRDFGDRAEMLNCTKAHKAFALDMSLFSPWFWVHRVQGGSNGSPVRCGGDEVGACRSIQHKKKMPNKTKENIGKNIEKPYKT